MSLNNMKLSEVEELIDQVEHLVIQLDRINKNSPNSERIVIRLEKASEIFDQSIKHGLNKIEKALFDLDYTKIESDLANIIRNQVVIIINSMERIKQHTKALEEAHKKTDILIMASDKMIDVVDHKIKDLTKSLNLIPSFNRNLTIAAASGGFVAGAAALYLLSLVVWLPKPYFATLEQSVLLDMVQDQALRIESSAIDTLNIRVDYDILNKNSKNTNTNTGENK